MAHLTFLEQFSNENGPALGPLVEDLPGYSDGFAAGMVAAAADTKRLSAKMVDKFTELRFGYAEAQVELLNALTPLINAICDQILPDILDDITRSKLSETLLLAAQTDLSAPISLTLHPDNQHVIESLLSDGNDFNLKIMTDAVLGANEILIGTDQQETQLDVSAMTHDLRAALQTISNNKGIYKHE